MVVVTAKAHLGSPDFIPLSKLPHWIFSWTPNIQHLQIGISCQPSSSNHDSPTAPPRKNNGQYSTLYQPTYTRTPFLVTRSIRISPSRKIFAACAEPVTPWAMIAIIRPPVRMVTNPRASCTRNRLLHLSSYHDKYKQVPLKRA